MVREMRELLGFMLRENDWATYFMKTLYETHSFFEIWTLSGHLMSDLKVV